ncbi:MAG: hypothetical protein V9H69_06200, partial [Anaerolineae bacterium]
MIPGMQRRYRETTSDYMRQEYERFMSARPCPTCEGKRLRKEALGVTITDQNIVQVTTKSVSDALRWVATLQSDEERRKATDSLNGAAAELPPTPLSPHEQTHLVPDFEGAARAAGLSARCRPGL